MKLSSKNPVQGFVKCEHCGKPAPVHKPKGGPRKNTFYYNCVEHKNQQGRGVHEYIVAEMVPTLEEWAEKWDGETEAEELRQELAVCGLAEPGNVTNQEETTVTEPIFTPAEDDESVVIDNESGQVVTEPTEQPKQASNAALLLFIIVCVVLIAGAGFILVKRFKETKPQSTPQPTPQPTTQAVKSELQPGMNQGVLL